MKLKKRELREEWAGTVWRALEFWMLRSRVSRRDFNVDMLEDVVSNLRRILTFNAYLKATRRDAQKSAKKRAAALLRASLATRVPTHTLHHRGLLMQWQRTPLSRTEQE
jgi:hypothetical protein